MSTLAHTRRHLAGIPNPTDAALWLRDESGINRDAATELLVEHVTSHLKRITSRRTAATQSNAIFGWLKAVRHGTFDWDRAETLSGLLAAILRTAGREDRDQTYRQYERHVVNTIDDAEAAEVVYEHASDTYNPHQQLCDLHADLIEAQTYVAAGRQTGATPVLAKRAAIIDLMFATIPLSPFSESQARRARAKARDHNPTEVAAAVLDGTGDPHLAGELFPFLLGLTPSHTRQALTVIAGWATNRADIAMRALLHHDTVRHGPNAGSYGPHIVPAAAAPKTGPLNLAG